MANIESKLTTIRSASGGEDVRDAIIGALRDINNDVPADMSNPKQKEYNMPPGSDLTVPINPPELISQIIVRQPNSGGKSTTLQDITITENGEYPTDDEGYDPNKENRYYSKVTVKVPQLANAVVDLEEEITQNGTYSAPADWGVDGIRTFTVNVNAATGDGPFQVEFYDKVQSDPTTTVKETQLIPKGGSAMTSYQPVSPTGQIFTGWNPDPVNVTRDMKCYPRFADKTIVPGEIFDDWEVICSNGGTNYALGNYKNLPFSFTWKVADILNVVPDWADHPSISDYPDATATMTADFIMYKVAVGEQGTKSTWLSRPTTCTLAFANPSRSPGKLFGSPFGGYPGYSGSVVDLFLENVFFPTMASCFHQHIKGVNKYHQALDPAKTSPPYNQTVINRHIWIPSIKEIMSTGAIEFANNQTNLHIPIDNASYANPALNKEIFYDNVPNAMAYFRDVLGLSTQNFLDSMMASGLNFVLRDSYTHDTGYTGWYYPSVSQGNGIIYDYNCQQGYHLDGNLMIGFCLD